MAGWERTIKNDRKENFSNQPFEASVTSTDSQEESLDFDGATGPDTSRVPHPMLSPNSWIRALPESGARIIVSTVEPERRRATLSYYSRMVSEYIQRYNDGAGLYRPLKEGEWELMSPGVAQVFGTSKGRLYLRGGPIQHQLDPVKLRMRSRAPTYKRELHRNLDDKLENEERFGVVVRHKSPDKKNRWIQVPLVGETQEKDYRGDAKTRSFAIEYLRKFGRDGTSLVDIRQGDVFDETGTQIKMAQTNKPLRHMAHYYNVDASEKLSVEIDERNNAVVQTPGTQLQVLATQATLSARLAVLEIQTSSDIRINSNTTVNIRGNNTARIAGSTQTILGPDAVAINSVIKGNQLVSTVLAPLISLLIGLFQGGSSQAVNSHASYKGLLKAAGAALSPLQGALIATLSSNVKTSG